MSAYDVMGYLDDIAATTSRKTKEEILVKLLDKELGQFAVKWAYDPFVTYGITSPQQPSAGTLDLAFRPAIIQPLLERLARRELSGNAAQREVAEVMEALDKAGAELLYRILAKDLKCGINVATINAVMPGFVPVFSVMRAHHFEDKRVKKWPVAVEPKLDGYRYTFLCRDGNGQFFSRSGIPQPAAAHLIEPMVETALAALEKGSVALRHTLLEEQAALKSVFSRDKLNFMVDGEMMVPGDFNATGALRRTSEAAVDAYFNVFDIMSYADFDATGSVGKPYAERRKLVDEFASFSANGAITKTPRYLAHSVEEVFELYERFRARKLEGAMVKLLDGLYDKKKSYGWLKIKAEDTEDLPIVGVYNGELGSKYGSILGGVIVRRANGVDVRVGGGFSDEERETLWKDWEHDAKLLGRTDAFVGFKPGWASEEFPADEDGFKLLGRLSEVEFHEETPDGSLRHPRHKRFRDDKRGEIESKEAA